MLLKKEILINIPTNLYGIFIIDWLGMEYKTEYLLDDMLFYSREVALRYLQNNAAYKCDYEIRCLNVAVDKDNEENNKIIDRVEVID